MDGTDAAPTGADMIFFIRSINRPLLPELMNSAEVANASLKLQPQRKLQRTRPAHLKQRIEAAAVAAAT